MKQNVIETRGKKATVYTFLLKKKRQAEEHPSPLSMTPTERSEYAPETFRGNSKHELLAEAVCFCDCSDVRRCDKDEELSKTFQEMKTQLISTVYIKVKGSTK